MMKIRYNTPTIYVLLSECEDVITSSDTTFNGMQNGGTYNEDSETGSTDWGRLFG